MMLPIPTVSEGPNPWQMIPPSRDPLPIMTFKEIGSRSRHIPWLLKVKPAEAEAIYERRRKAANKPNP